MSNNSFLKEGDLPHKPMPKARTVGWQGHIGGGEPIDHADCLVLWQLAASRLAARVPARSSTINVNGKHLTLNPELTPAARALLRKLQKGH
jgi:hypothetical protein